MKSWFTVLCLISALGKIYGQSSGTLTIEESYRLAAERYPMIKQRDLIASSEEYSISNEPEDCVRSFYHLSLHTFVLVKQHTLTDKRH